MSPSLPAMQPMWPRPSNWGPTCPTSAPATPAPAATPATNPLCMNFRRDTLSASLPRNCWSQPDCMESSCAGLFCQPHRVELLVQEVARHDRPAPDLGEMRDDPV